MSMKMTRCEFVHGMSCKEVSKFLAEIVRCRDCKYLVDDDSMWVCDGFCANIEFNDGTPPDGFCSWGERRQA